MEVCGLRVVVRHTFLQVDNMSKITTRQRACSDSAVCHDDDVSTVADSDCLSNCGRWGCQDLDLDMASDTSAPASSPGVSLTPSSPSTPLTPPGVFSPPPSRSLLGTHKSKVQHDVSDTRTTLMLRNLPSSFSQKRLLDVLNATGFSDRYDFVYLPVDFQSGAGLGYAFVNMINPADASLAVAKLSGYSEWGDAACRKVLEVCWSDPHQGLDMLIDRYRNSRVMHKSVPESYKPLLLHDGKKVAFPAPTKRVRSPL